MKQCAVNSLGIPLMMTIVSTTEPIVCWFFHTGTLFLHPHFLQIFDPPNVISVQLLDTTCSYINVNYSCLIMIELECHKYIVNYNIINSYRSNDVHAGCINIKYYRMK